MSSKPAIVVAIAAVSCIGLGLGWCSLCTKSAESAGRAATNVKPATTSGDKTAVMGFLDTRGNKITLYGNGRFGIADKHGKLLIDNASLEEVKKRAPELAGILDRAVARDMGGDTGPTMIRMHDDARNYRKSTTMPGTGIMRMNNDASSER